MKVELLEEDELLVELELRGLIDPRQGKITPELKDVLARRLKEEQVHYYGTPRVQHKSAIKQPEHEVTICQTKLRAVQRFLLEGITAGSTVEEMYPQLRTSLIHVHGRICRSAICPIFSARSASLKIIMDILGDMVAGLRKDRISVE